MVYKIKPIITQNDEIILPKCMYSVRSVHGKSPRIGNVEDNSGIKCNIDVTSQVNTLLKLPMREMADLEIRQDKLLQGLELLHSQIHALKEQLKSNTTSGKKEVIGVDNIEFPDDIVINANPSSPPHSLILLRNILRSQITIKLAFYLHSTVQKLSKIASEFQQMFIDTKECSSLPTINIRLIWKDNGDYSTTLILSPTSTLPICGETNILRYFATCFSHLNPAKNSIENAIELNSALDLCYLLQKQSVSAKSKENAARGMIRRLSSTKWFAGDAISIADLALYSVLQNINIPILNSTVFVRWRQELNAYL